MVQKSVQRLDKAQPFRLDNYQVEPPSLRIISTDRVVRLEPKAMQLLVYLATHAGRVISRAELEENIWSERVVGNDALTNMIAKLRRAFADDARHPKIIETLPKTGYRLIADVFWLDLQAEAPANISARSGKLTPLFNPFWLGVLGVLAVLTGMASWQLLKQPAATNIDIYNPGDGTEGKLSIAIIPFVNLGEKPEHDYFSNGITANLITDLSKISGLLVIAPGSVSSYLSDSHDVKHISQELNVDYVVRGNVQRQGDNVRVYAQLVQADNEQALWAEHYDKTVSNVFELQDQVATAIVAELRIKLAPSERDVFNKQLTSSAQAYDLFLRGLEEYGHHTLDSNHSAGNYFEQAYTLDPNFAHAITGLALVHMHDAIEGWTPTPTHSMEIAAELAKIAANINPSIPQVHFVIGHVALFRQQHVKAYEATLRAIHYNPNYADAYALLARIMIYAGQPDKAAVTLETAIQLNPLISAPYHEIRGEIHYLQGDYFNAITSFDKALQINPLHMRARIWLIATLTQTGEQDEAQWQVTELTLSTSNFTLDYLKRIFPFQDQSVRNKLVQDLRTAGLSD